MTIGDPVQVGAREIIANVLIEDAMMNPAAVFLYVCEKMLKTLYEKADTEGFRIDSWRMDMEPHKPSREDMYREDFAMHTTDMTLTAKGTKI